MTSPLDIERTAARLRTDLKRAKRPDVRMACCLTLFQRLADVDIVGGESYVREFLANLVNAAEIVDPRDLMPSELESLDSIAQHLRKFDKDLVAPDAIASVRKPVDGVAVEGLHDAPKSDGIVVKCVFVEHYPDLSLAPRGRVLDLAVSASALAKGVDSDDIVVRNPTDDPGERFLAQAQVSLLAARTYIERHHRLSKSRRYRLDYQVLSSGARFSGDSLGLAFAVGAVAAISRLEVLREQLVPLPEVVLTGALSEEGGLLPVDSDSLELKVNAAMGAKATYMVVPGNHQDDAIRAIEQNGDAGQMEIRGAETLEDVLSDRRLVGINHLCPMEYAAKKLTQTKATALGISLPLLLIAYALICIVYPKAWIGFDWNPNYVQVTKTGFNVFNADSLRLWSDHFLGESLSDVSPWEVGDLNGDGINEVGFIPHLDWQDNSETNTILRVYSSHGDILFTRSCAIEEDSTSIRSDQRLLAQGVDFVNLNGRVLIVTTACDVWGPSHIRFWETMGNPLSEYENYGTCKLETIASLPDGTDVLVFVGYNNQWSALCMFALDPYQDSGHSPVGVRDSACGRQRAFMLFPRSEINRRSNAIFHTYEYLTEQGLNLRLCTREFGELHLPGLRHANAYYYFNDDLRVDTVRIGDGYRKHHRLLVPEDTTWNQIGMNLRDAVRYWTDSGWVTESQLRTLDVMSP